MSASDSRERLLRRVEDEIAAGRVWRAREMLGSAVIHFISDAAVLERYGRVLEQLGEKREAGKFYFLSGVRKPEYREAIEIFRGRAARHGAASFLAQLPSAAKRVGLDALPAVTVAELRELGVSEARLRYRRPSPRPGRQVGEVNGLAGPLILTSIAMVFVAGIVSVGGWLIRAIVWVVG